MDMEKRARRQSRRIIISEALMVITVIITVSILAFIVSGYWVNSDFKIERQGLLQIYSTPTGATIQVDHETSSWAQHTNTSKTLPAGEHTITLTKEGYDTWSRTIKITEGLLYRLHYPRLFLQNRTVETAFDFSATSVNSNTTNTTNSPNFATITPDRNTMLIADNTTSWQLLNLDTTDIKPTTLDLSKILPFTSRASNASIGLFTGTIADATWASDNEHLLLKLTDGTTINWLLLNIKNPSLSVNLTQDFNTDFTKVQIIDQSASHLLAVTDGNLHRIDVPAKQISAILVPNIHNFDFYNQNVVFTATKDTHLAQTTDTNSAEPPYYLGLLKLGDSEIKELKTITTPAEVVITRFYDDEYIGVINGSQITLYLKNNFEEKSTFSLSFEPKKVKVGIGGESITMYSDGRIASLDMEAMQLFDWTTDTDTFGWLDSSMIYAIKDSSLNVYDFNGLNHRILSNNVSTHFPVTITADKYLYYFRDGSLIREYLTEK